ncbi:hypothetical protein BDQ17DRAFT_1410959 [Cyathus striatus]|nr:hypothetical protein BDQ17DRAFT_1410959 [Cyathus striatus]
MLETIHASLSTIQPKALALIWSRPCWEIPLRSNQRVAHWFGQRREDEVFFVLVVLVTVLSIFFGVSPDVGEHVVGVYFTSYYDACSVCGGGEWAGSWGEADVPAVDEGEAMQDCWIERASGDTEDRGTGSDEDGCRTAADEETRMNSFQPQFLPPSRQPSTVPYAFGVNAPPSSITTLSHSSPMTSTSTISFSLISLLILLTLNVWLRENGSAFCITVGTGHHGPYVHSDVVEGDRATKLHSR